MDERVQKSKRTDEGNIELQRTDIKEICKNKKSKKAKPGRRKKEKPPEIIAADHLKGCVDHFFPKGLLSKWIGSIPDPRIQEMCTYDLRHLTWLGLLMFLLRLESRRQLLKESETECFRLNLLELSGTDEYEVAHPDTLNYLLEFVSVNELEKVKVKMVKQLIKDKRLDTFRLGGKFRIAIDATQLFSFSEQHCEHCLKTEHSSGKITWSHQILEAKLVAENGLSLSICSEPIENENGTYDKQDCELKALYRLEKKLKRTFPRTPFCLLLDGLYACQGVLDLCRKHNWEYLIILKKGSIPTLFDEAVQAKESNSVDTVEIIIDKKITQKLSWVCYLKYGKNYVHVIFCEERRIEKGEEVIKNWVWISSFLPDRYNIAKLVNKGGRQRWKIENQGFKEQKKDDFGLEHLYGESPNAWKNYYQLLQIAHILDQLMRYGDFCKKLQEHSMKQQNKPILPFREYYQSTRNFIRRLAESFRTRLFSELAYILPGNIQIRFDSG